MARDKYLLYIIIIVYRSMMVVKSNEKKQEERPAGLFFQYTRFKREKTIVKCHGDFLQAKSQLRENSSWRCCLETCSTLDPAASRFQLSEIIT